METCQKHIKVIEPECDLRQKMSISNIMRHAQQMGSDHLEQFGLDYNQMVRDGMVFLVAKQLITIHRRPSFGERLLLTTIPRKPKGAQFIRDTLFETEEGERLVEVSIAWLLADPQTHKILRPAMFDIYGLEMFPNEGESITRYRIQKPESAAIGHLRQVRFSDLDYNGHMNNAIYAEVVMDALPAEAAMKKEPASFGILFQKEAKFGQVINLEVCPREENGYYIGGQVAGERCFEAEILFR
jgi:acyl-ACP thioesterase